MGDLKVLNVIQKLLKVLILHGNIPFVIVTEVDTTTIVDIDKEIEVIYVPNEDEHDLVKVCAVLIPNGEL